MKYFELFWKDLTPQAKARFKAADLPLNRMHEINFIPVYIITVDDLDLFHDAQEETFELNTLRSMKEKECEVISTTL